MKDDNRRVEEEIIRLKTKVDQLRKVLTQQDRNRQSTHQRTQVVGQVQQVCNLFFYYAAFGIINGTYGSIIDGWLS